MATGAGARRAARQLLRQAGARRNGDLAGAWWATATATYLHYRAAPEIHNATTLRLASLAS